MRAVLLKVRHKTVVLLIAVFSLLFIASCKPAPKPMIFSACIVRSSELHGNIIGHFIYTDQDELYSFSVGDSTQIIDENDTSISIADLVVGDMVYVEATGPILEVAPGIISNVTLIQITGKADDEMLQAGIDYVNMFQSSVNS